MSKRLYFIPLLALYTFCWLPGCGPSGSQPVVQKTTLTQQDIQRLIDLALKDFEKKKYAAALASLSQAEKADPNSAFIQNLVGATYTKQKNFSAAKTAFARAMKLEPDFFPAAYNQAEVLFLEGNYVEAYDNFTTLLAKNPSSELLQFKVLLCLIFLDRKDGAQRLLKQIKMPGEGPGGYYSKAAWEYSMGDKKKGLEYLKTARLLFPEGTLIYDETFRDLGWEK